MSDRTGMAMGNLRPLVYFENRKDEKKPIGYVMLSPETNTSHTYTPPGYEVMYAKTWPEVTALQKKLEQQEMEERDWEVETYKQQFSEARKQKRENIMRLMTSPDTTEYEKLFLERFLQIREDRREKYIKLFSQRTAYLNILAADESKCQQRIIDKLEVNR